MAELIDREEAIQCVKNNSYTWTGDIIEVNGHGVIKDIKALPTIDEKEIYQRGFIAGQDELLRESRPKGKWIDGTMDCGVIHPRCNNCMWSDCQIPENKIREMDYCPNCGADMRGEE